MFRASLPRCAVEILCTAGWAQGKLPSVLVALAGGESRGLSPISADVHAAPAARAFLAGVEEVENTGVALADTGGVFVGKELGGAVGERGEEVAGVVGGKPEFGLGGLTEAELDGVIGQEVVELVGEIARDGLAFFPELDGRSERFAEV